MAGFQSSLATSPSLTLKKIMEEPVLLKGFSDFCKVQHAYENLDFWLAVETFRELFRGDDATGSIPPNPGSPLSPNSRKSIRRTFWSMTSTLPRIGSARSFEEGTKDSPKGGDVTLLGQAKRIFQEYLAPHADKWVCVDQAESDEIKRKLDAGNQDLLDFRLFDVVQKQVYINMEKDLVPRFAKTFEIEEETTVFQPSQPVRGSVRFVPDQKLRATLVKTTNLSGSETESK